MAPTLVMLLSVMAVAQAIPLDPAFAPEPIESVAKSQLIDDEIRERILSIGKEIEALSILVTGHNLKVIQGLESEVTQVVNADGQNETTLSSLKALNDVADKLVPKEEDDYDDYDEPTISTTAKPARRTAVANRVIQNPGRPNAQNSGAGGSRGNGQGAQSGAGAGRAPGQAGNAQNGNGQPNNGQRQRRTTTTTAEPEYYDEEVAEAEKPATVKPTGRPNQRPGQQQGQQQGGQPQNGRGQNQATPATAPPQNGRQQAAVTTAPATTQAAPQPTRPGQNGRGQGNGPKPPSTAQGNGQPETPAAQGNQAAKPDPISIVLTERQVRQIFNQRQKQQPKAVVSKPTIVTGNGRQNNNNRGMDVDELRRNSQVIQQFKQLTEAFQQMSKLVDTNKMQTPPTEGAVVAVAGTERVLPEVKAIGGQPASTTSNPLDPLVKAAIGVQGQFGDALRNLLPGKRL
ncbi:hypothetical protein HDE_07677 [Halotydeus destructor]|nr:hypothetical protein HDE_07677 [Halotydeus destructor]